MKTLVSSAFAVMAAFALNAQTHWFDAGIADYASWPEDGSNKEIAGVGVWTNTVGAVMEGDAGERYLVVSTSKVLEFGAAVAQDVANEPTISTYVLMAACDEAPEITPDVKGAMAIIGSGAVSNYCGVAKSAATGTNEWFVLSGATPAAGEMVTLGISYRLSEQDAIEISYSIDGVALEFESGSEWAEIVFPDEDFEVSRIGYSGTGEVASLSGAVADQPVSCILLTVPGSFEGMSLVSVSVGGVAVEPDENGKYAIPEGALVAVEFAPSPSCFLSSNTMTFYAGSEDMDLPVEGRPVVTQAADVLRVSEVMASNETCLRTAGGVLGLDWVEIENKSPYNVDISGWYLSDKVPSKNKWVPIEGSAVVPANGHLVVFVDTDFANWNGRDAHAAIGLSSSGESISLATPDKTVVSTFDFEQQFKDVSFGWGRRSRTILGAYADAQYKVGDGEWTGVQGPIGMSAEEGGFQVVSYAFNGLYPTTVDDVNNFIADPTCYRQDPATNRLDTLCFNDGSSTSFPSTGFPGVNGDAFALVCTGTISIPRAGMWTFEVGSDDGFTAKISRNGKVWAWEYNGTRGYGATTAAFNLPEPGAYDVEIYYWEYNGGACFEFAAAEGNVGFDANVFKLVGDSSGEIVHAGAYAAKVVADLAPEMVGIETNVQWRSSFTLEEEPDAEDSFRLKIRYSDGFVARINGTEFASAAVADRSPVEALVSEFFDIPRELVAAGVNTVEITGVNSDIDDTEFFLSPEVLWNKAEEELVYFDTPTPKAANNYAGRLGLTPVVTLSEPHGWKTGPFELSMSCAEDPNAAIFYTTDGTQPTVGSTPYTGPITISGTTVVRAAAPDADAILQRDAVATYLYIDDVLSQTSTEAPEGFPANQEINGQAFRYGLANPSIMNSSDPEIIRRLYDGFTNSARTVSLVIDPKNLFDPSIGIYVNASGNGRTWERPTMVEQINPMDSTDEYTAMCGLRIRGAFSRNPVYPKHSFRLFFRSDYGYSKLNHPLFGDEGADEFDKIDLRTDQNYSYANGAGNETMITELFSRDSERDMGTTYHRTRYFHLFINGVYWGLYMYEERCSQEYAASYNGGAEENYDVVRTSQPGYSTGTVEGSDASRANLWNIAMNQGFGDSYPNNYNKVRGLNPDGTRNPDYPVYVNVTNTILYCLSAHYVGDSDSPSSGGTANNIAAFRNRVDGDGKEDGWMFNRHDAEHSMGYNYGGNKLTHDITGWGTKEAGCTTFNPAGLHYELCANAEYRQVVADLFYKHFLRKGGAMTPENCEARLRARMAEIDDAIVPEIARWGWEGCTYQNWLNNCEGNCVNFVRGRTPYFLAEYRARGWYPAVDAPNALDEFGVQVQDGDKFALGGKIRLSGSSSGTVYYTTDGSDPRLEGGEVSSSALSYTGSEPAGTAIGLVAKNESWKYFDWGSAPAGDWKSASFDDSDWNSGSGPLGCTGSGVASVGTALARYVNHAESGTQVTTYYFRKSFNVSVDDADKIKELSAEIYCDDGCIVYLNGVELGRYNMNAGAVDYGTFSSSGINPSGYIACEWAVPDDVLVAGENVIAVEVHQCNASSTDLVWDASFDYTKLTDDGSGIEVPAAGMKIRARVLTAGGEWSALEEVDVLGSKPVETLGMSVRIVEFCGIPADDVSGDVGEYVVLTNLATETSFDLAGVNIVIGKTKDINKSGDSASKMNITLGAMSILPNGTVRLDQADYAEAGWTKITNGDLLIRIYDASGNLIQSSAVNQNNFPTVTDANMLGASLIATDFGADTSESGWKASFSPEFAFLRFHSFDGITTGNKGDVDEWVVLTNVSSAVAIDLSGVRVVIGKAADVAEGTSKMDVTLADGVLAGGGSANLQQAVYGWTKITNGNLELRLYDADGALVQSSSLAQKEFPNYYGSGGPGGADYLVAKSFGHALAQSDWRESSAPETSDADLVAEDIAEIGEAKSGAVDLPNDAEISVDGNTVTVAIGEAADTIEIPAYYTPSVSGGTLSLALNDLALPTIADTVDSATSEVEIPAIQVVNGEILLNVTAAESSLWYGLKIATALPAEWDAIEVGNWVSGEALTTLTAEAADDAGFYKIVVTDIDPAAAP